MSQVEDLERLAALKANGVLTEEEFKRAKDRLVNHIADPNKAPLWMKPFGYYACIIALACAALVGYHHYERSRGDEVEVLMGILLNPLVFILLPLGLYWLHRAGEFRNPEPPLANPKVEIVPVKPTVAIVKEQQVDGVTMAAMSLVAIVFVICFFLISHFVTTRNDTPKAAKLPQTIADK